MKYGAKNLKFSELQNLNDYTLNYLYNSNDTIIEALFLKLINYEIDFKFKNDIQPFYELAENYNFDDFYKSYIKFDFTSNYCTLWIDVENIEKSMQLYYSNIKYNYDVNMEEKNENILKHVNYYYDILIELEYILYDNNLSEKSEELLQNYYNILFKRIEDAVKNLEDVISIIGDQIITSYEGYDKTDQYIYVKQYYDFYGMNEKYYTDGINLYTLEKIQNPYNII